MTEAPTRSPVARILGWVTGAVVALPALAAAPWLVIGLAWGWSGTDGSGTTTGETDWGQVLGCAGLLLASVAVPVLAGMGVFRGLHWLIRQSSTDPD